MPASIETDAFVACRERLWDERSKARIAPRISRLGAGLMGDVEPVGGGGSEARIHDGPGAGSVSLGWAAS